MESKYKESFIRDVMSYLQCFAGEQFSVATVTCCVDGLELTGIAGRISGRNIVPVAYLEDISGRASAEKAACIIAGKIRTMLSGIPVKRSRLLLRDYAHFCNLDVMCFFCLPGSNDNLSTEQMRDLKLILIPNKKYKAGRSVVK